MRKLAPPENNATGILQIGKKNIKWDSAQDMKVLIRKAKRYFRTDTSSQAQFTKQEGIKSPLLDAGKATLHQS